MKNGSSLMFSVRRVCVGARTVLRLPEKRTRYVLRLKVFFFFADPLHAGGDSTRTKKKKRPPLENSQSQRMETTNNVRR